jgi:glutamate-ammonia-ligase adenylyltransferase
MTAPAKFGITDAFAPALTAAGWSDGEAVAERAVPLLRSLQAGPDAAGGIARLAAILGDHPGLGPAALQDPRVGAALIAICGASESISTWLRTEPGWLLEAAATEPAAVPLELHGIDGTERRRRIREFTHRRMTRIGVWDLTERATMPDVGRALANLADAIATAVVSAAITDLAARPEFADLPLVPFLTVAMGKWGGRELNYASDIDVLFIYEVPDGSDAAAAARFAGHVATRFMDDIGRPTPDGVAFRVDADLRPEGRQGPLARTLSAYRTYYERWADTWEFQALIKARPVAGDPVLAEAFGTVAAAAAYPATREPGFVSDIRTMKSRIEEEAVRRGIADTGIKRGLGGIRDVEFAVQLLQLVHGGVDPDLRARATLDALAHLEAHGYVRPEDAVALADSYGWLRNVEHRLQLHRFRQTHELPTDPVGRDRIAKAMGYRDTSEQSAIRAFDAELTRHRGTVRTIHERLFHRPLLEAFAASERTGLSSEAMARQLAALGFRDEAGARRAFADLTAGLTRRSRLMQQLLPLMLEWLSIAPDPDLGLAQLRLLVTGAKDNDQLIGALRDNPVAAARLCRMLGTSRLLGRLIDRVPAALPVLGDDARLAAVPGRAELIDSLLQRIAVRPERDRRLRALRRFVQQGFLDCAMRDLAGFAGPAAIGRQLSDIADAAAAAALVIAGGEILQQPDYADAGPLPFAVIAMGKWGGRELNFASDLDVVFVHQTPGDTSGPDAAGFAARLAEEFLAVLGGVSAEGTGFHVDPDLRPEGKNGPLSRSLESYRVYYEQWADTWEFQALIKARFVAGDEATGRAFLDLIRPYVYLPEFGPDRIREARKMKARIERERIAPSEDPEFHMKLGSGGMSDVEFTVQLLQLRHGGADESLREPGTLPSITALQSAGLLTSVESETLTASYEFCSLVRNRLYLQAGRTRDSLPSDPAEASRLARSLGFDSAPRAALRDRYRQLTRRARRVVERRFYRD